MINEMKLPTLINITRLLHQPDFRRFSLFYQSATKWICCTIVARGPPQASGLLQFSLSYQEMESFPLNLAVRLEYSICKEQHTMDYT